MNIQFGNQDLNQTMSSTIAQRKYNVMKEISQFRKKIEKAQQILKEIQDQQAQIQNQSQIRSINLQLQQLNRMRNRLEIQRPSEVQRQIRGQQQIGSRKSSSCIIHSKRYSLICFTCRKSICDLCRIRECSQHKFLDQQQGLKKLSKQLYQSLVPQVKKQIIFYERSIDSLQKKMTKLKERVECHFKFLDEILHKKKFQIMDYFTLFIQNRLICLYPQRKKFLGILQNLQKYTLKEYQPKTIEDYQFLSKRIQGSFSFIKQQQNNKVRREINIDLDFGQKNMQKIHRQIQRLEYTIDSQPQSPVPLKSKKSKSIEIVNSSSQFNAMMQVPDNRLQRKVHEAKLRQVKRNLRFE